ncbi:ATP-dependent RNA helicase HrpA [Utexia brackfieldae]|uniref:ATP-dependent RNA helicase HrpA n=1 Tax=Utexia brackfieldae TaxID=3074108 RepID=UPI00370D3431
MPHQNQLQPFFAKLDTVGLIEKIKLKNRLNLFAKQTVIDSLQWQAFEQQFSAAQQRYQQRAANCPNITYPQGLPVVDKKAQIYQAIKDHQVVIIAGETGSGKTTQIPKICLELGRGIKGYIGHTQPRRLAARSVASRIAEELNSELGAVVGYKVRFHDQVGENALIKLMTDGVLLAEIQQDKLLRQYDTIIIDEAHERSLNIDFILGYLKQILPKRPDLKVIITSATIDPERFSQHFNDAPIIEVSGRTYPVEIRYRAVSDVTDQESTDNDQLQAIINAVDELSFESADDILIFLTGEREIRDVADALTKLNLRHTEILPLYARLSAGEQNRIFQPHNGRHIILATNVAETSLTVPGIKYVIDTGQARISRYSVRTKVQRLPIEPISQASANQRAGRCGRTSDGICIRLYDEQDFLSRPEFTQPEILRTNLASVILQMTALGLGDIAAFPFVEAPDKRHIQDGIRLLEELNAVEFKRQHYQLTEVGKALAQLPVDPRLGRMIVEAKKYGCVKELMIVTAALSIQDPRERPLDKQQASDEKHRRFSDKDSDFMSLINLWRYLQTQQAELSSNQFRKLCKQEYLNYLRVREWQDIYTQLRQTVKELKFAINSQEGDYTSIHLALLSGLLSHVGMKEVDKHEFIGARNIKFSIFPNSGIFKKPPKWCLVAELVETTRLWGRIAAKIEPEWIEPLAQHLIKRSYSEPHWSKAQGTTMANEKVTLFGLPIVNQRQVNYSQIDPVLSRELFIRHALVEGDWQTKHAFYKKNLSLIHDVETLEHKSRRKDILVDDHTLYAFYDERLPANIVSSRHFDTWWNSLKSQQPDLLNFEKIMLINESANQISRLDYPDYWQQGNLKLPLSYQFEPGSQADGVTVQVPLAVLNQLSEQGFEWQIPGLRKDLIIALIKSLPKPIRRNFVPAPDYAQAFLERVTALSLPLLEALEKEFRRMSGLTIDRESWQWTQVPDYLKITFRVIDLQGKILAESKDLTHLKQSLKQQVQQTLSSVVQDEKLAQRDLVDWHFGTLPTVFQDKKGQYTVKAYPALVDNQQSVSIKLVDTIEEQQRLTLVGIRRLLLLNSPSPIKYLHEKLPNKSKLGLYFNPFGNIPELIDDCIACAIDHLIIEQGGLVWNQQDFARLLDFVKANLNPLVVEIAQQVEKILTLNFNINKKLKGRIDLSLAFALSDIKAQLSHLVYKGFVTKVGYSRLGDIYRYLQAIEKRLDKLAIDPNKDRAHIHKIEQVQQAYQQFMVKLPDEKRQLKEVNDIGWMIEELRVNLFAQQLGTPYPISDKRIVQQIDNLTKILEAQ